MSRFKNPLFDQLEPLAGHPVLLNLPPDPVKAIDWIAANKEDIEEALKDPGILVIRGLKVLGSKQFGQILTMAFGEDLMKYTYRSTPRTELRGNVYTTTEYHPHELIPQHNENAYSNNWPLRAGFLCMVPPPEGGETPLADSRVIYEKIPAAIRETFEQKRIMYVRNYSDIDLPWSEVFQTEDPQEVETYCEANQIDYEWLEGNRLRTRQINDATAIHPLTQDTLWFNQAHLFHISSLDPKTRQDLINLSGEENLPRNTYYGDGSPIDEADLQVIRDIYETHKFSFRWQKNDLAFVDNMLFSHGRSPYSGPRKVLVGFARVQYGKS